MASTPSVSIRTSHPLPSRLWLLLPMIGVLAALAGYLWLPQLGIGAIANLLNFKKLLLLAAAGIGGVFYLAYLRFVSVRPQLLVVFIGLAWPVVNYLSGLLMDMGLNIHLRPLLILVVAGPGAWIALRHSRMLWREVPWMKWYLLFFAWLVLYFFFNNANAVDPRLGGGEDAIGEGSVSFVQLTSYFYCLLAILVTAVAMLKLRNFRPLFDGFNQMLLWVSGIEALITIAGYPFGGLTLVVDGFTRSTGIFSHPNPFSHHMGILMIYLLGLFCYYQGERSQRLPGWLLFAGLGVNFMAFLLGLSKTAIGLFALCAGLLFLLNLTIPVVRRRFFQGLLALAVLAPVGLAVFQALSGESLFSLLESRISDTKSLDWRTDVWNDLLSEINAASIWLGHGFTAANATVFRLTFSDARNAQPLMMVHNAYIALIYDLGVMGYAMFLAALALAWQAVSGWVAVLKSAVSEWQERLDWARATELSIILALTVYFMAVCAFDEMSYMFDAPQLYWTLVTLLFCLHRRETAMAATRTAAPAAEAVHPATLDELWARQLDSGEATGFWGKEVLS